MNPHLNRLLAALRSPESTADLGLADWNNLLQALRVARLLPAFAAELDSRGLTERLPQEIQPYCIAARNVAHSSDRDVRWEVNRLEWALRDLQIPIALLKGGAYVTAGLPLRGRLCSDIDILASANRLETIEQRLLDYGWKRVDVNDLDDRYYRSWLQELPPLYHPERGLHIDIHHTLLPRIDRLQFDAVQLLESARRISGSGFLILAPEDMVIHSGVHLFRNGDFRNGLRDLFDLHRLMRLFGEQAGFGMRLTQRIEQQRLTSPCFFVFTYLAALFATPLPAEVRSALDDWRPRWPQPQIMDRLISKALMPSQFDVPDRSQKASIWLLSHWPLHRLRTLVSPLFWTKRLRKKNAV